jgi:molybdate/tungstate transport system permease protein
VFIGLPILALFTNTQWAHVAAVLNSAQSRGAIETSVGSATLSTALVTAFGIPLGYALARYRFPGRSLITGLVYLPLVLPPVVAGVLLLLVWGQTGSVAQFLVPNGLVFVNEFSGIVLCQMFVSSPFVVILARNAFESIDPDLDEAARTMGADTLRAFWSVDLPIASRAILAGISLSWMRAFGEFGATVIVAYHPFSFPVYLYEQFSSAGYTPVLPLALLALILGSIALVLFALLERVGIITAVIQKRALDDKRRLF